MLIIENSNIVNWNEYPEYVCAIVMQTTEDVKTTAGTTCPKGEEVTWLLDRSPENKDGILTISGKCNCLGGLGPGNGYFKNPYFPAEIVEIHHKPKKIIKLNKAQESYA